jgi:entry exclusion lipoprotein TrbK
MNFKYSVCIIGLSIVLTGCGGMPEASSENCSGRGMETALTAFKNDEAARQAFIDSCEAMKKGK